MRDTDLGVADGAEGPMRDTELAAAAVEGRSTRLSA